MKHLIKPLIVTVALAASSGAQAWGDREQGALLGLFLGSVITNAYRDNQEQRHYHPPVVVQPQPQPPVIVYGHPNRLYHPQVCQSVATFDQWGRYLGHRTYCR